MRPHARVMVVLLCLSLGCEGGSTNDAPDTLSDFLSAWSERVCAASVRCAPKLSGIESSLTALYCRRDQLIALVDTSQLDSRVRIDPAVAERCLASVETTICAAGFRIDALACMGLIANARADGESCWGDGECASGRCAGLDAACEGQCVPALAAGDPCGGTDGTSARCGAGLACSARTCVATTGLADAPCDEAGDCAAELVCAGARCTPLFARGESCMPSSAFTADRCAGDLVCGTGNVCGDGADRGESCIEDRCRPGLRCDMANGVCVDSVGPGEACTTDVNCPASFRCRDGECMPVPTAGEACAASGECGDGTICDAATGLCRRRAVGEPCESDDECDGFCDESAAPSVCVAARAVGAACEDRDECGNGAGCIGGVCTACPRFGGS